MKLIFAVMPWHSLEYPCLASGILSSVAASRPRPWQVQQINANLLWAAHLRAVTHGVFTLDDYSLMCNEYVYCLAGEWAFSAALTGPRSDEADAAYERVFSGPREHFEKLLLARESASAFLDRVAYDIVEQRPQVLALSTTFTQNVACLALAKRVKVAAPEIAVVIGGGNCDGEQGLALHRNYGFIDFLVRGEGELAFAQLLDKISDADRDFDGIGGLCWRSGSRSVANESRATAPINEVPTPQFDDFFAALDATGLRSEIRPSLVFEAARGCWWGEKHHCTFCGLNGGSMAFRSKDGGQALAQLEDLIQRYKVLDIIVTDNILDTRYFESFLPQLRDKQWDARIQYEIKANVKAPQLKLMAEAGVVHVQPGIESLSTTVLQLMRKGTTGCRNVQALRDLEHAGITVSWNYLVGFPGERDADYRTIIEQLPLLHHLQPPRGGVTRVSLQRFSPFFNDPTLGFPEKRPHEAYSLIYDLPERELQDLAFFFMSKSQGISADLEAKLRSKVSLWIRAYEEGAQLYFSDDGSSVVVHDLRNPRDPVKRFLTDRLSVTLHRSLRQSAKEDALYRSVMRTTGCSNLEAESTLQAFVDWGLVFREGGFVVGLDTEFIPFHSSLIYTSPDDHSFSDAAPSGERRISA